MVDSMECDDKGNLNGLVFNRSSLGPMCSDRAFLYKFELRRDEVNPKKIHMQIYTTEKPGFQLPEECVVITLFKTGIYEQVGNDVVALEAQTMDLKGYFPKSLMNKL